MLHNTPALLSSNVSPLTTTGRTTATTFKHPPSLFITIVATMHLFDVVNWFSKSTPTTVASLNQQREQNKHWPIHWHHTLRCNGKILQLNSIGALIFVVITRSHVAVTYSYAAYYTHKCINADCACSSNNKIPSTITTTQAKMYPHTCTCLNASHCPFVAAITTTNVTWNRQSAFTTTTTALACNKRYSNSNNKRLSSCYVFSVFSDCRSESLGEQAKWSRH